MNAKFKIILLVFAIIGGVGIFIWDRQDQSAFEAGPPKIQAFQSVTNGVVVVVGSFDYAEPNNRYPEFTESLVAYLAAHPSKQVTFANRTPGGSPIPTSPDVWALNGSYDLSPGPKWGATLNLERVRGGDISIRVEGAKGDDLLGKIAEAVVRSVTAPPTNLQIRAGNRKEFTLHLDRGKMLAITADGFVFAGNNPDAVWMQDKDKDDVARRKYRLEQAIRSFQAAQALEKNSNEPKLRIAQCLLSSYHYDADQARAILREIIDHGPKDKLRQDAEFTLAWSLERTDPAKSLATYRQLAPEITNGLQNLFLRARIGAVAKGIEAPAGDEVERKKKVVFADVERFLGESKKTNRSSLFLNIVHPYYDLQDPAQRAAKTLASIEELKPKYPGMAPYFLRDIVRSWGSVDASIYKAWKATVAELSEDLTRVAVPKYFYGNDFDYATVSLFNADEETAMEMVAIKELAAKAGYGAPPSEKMLVGKGSVLMNRGQLAEAMEVFKSLNGRTIRMGVCGPWGCGGCNCGHCPISTLALAEKCRVLLGLPETTPGFHRELKKPVATAESIRPIIAKDGETLWIAGSKAILHYSTAGEKLSTHSYAPPATPATAAVVGGKLYVGTMGGGLLEINKETFATRTIRVEDGLLSDHISDLKPAGEKLWIGYGHRTEKNMDEFGTSGAEGRLNFGRASTGGVGLMDLASGSVTNYFRPREIPNDNPSSWINKNEYGIWPPSLPALDIEPSADGSIYVAVFLRGLQRFEPGSGKWSEARFSAFCRSVRSKSRPTICAWPNITTKRRPSPRDFHCGFGRLPKRIFNTLALRMAFRTKMSPRCYWKATRYGLEGLVMLRNCVWTK